MNDHLISRSRFLDDLVLDADNKTDLIQVHQALEKAVISPDEVRGVGEWLPDVGEFGFPEIPCSVCGYKSGHYGFKYCPSCGARMSRAEAEAAMKGVSEDA